MTIVLDHTHIPARDKDASARLFAEVFGLRYAGPVGWYAAVRINESLKIAFVDYQEPAESHHYAFLVDDDEFDAILGRVRKAGVVYGSDPENPANGALNAFNGGRGFYFWTSTDI
jgi:catechol 2,3-dioxygenase-like lactoylglutathione lyase family enzyme